MIFHEIYGKYFETVAAILEQAVTGTLTQERLSALVQEHAFGESILTIPANLKDGTWPLLRADLTTPIRHTPHTPLTNLQKQWMKALLQDPRVRLFDLPEDGLEDVEPLYDPKTFVWFDRYEDGDPYENEEYIRRFRMILQALREHRRIKIKFFGHLGTENTCVFLPAKLEYSAKDDKFRLYAFTRGRLFLINLARIRSCVLREPFDPAELPEIHYREKSVVFALIDERNALERVMLHFSDLEKETVRLDETHYRVMLYYKQSDETEILIRILSFGPVLRVLEPGPFLDLIRERLNRQRLVSAASR